MPRVWSVVPVALVAFVLLAMPAMAGKLTAADVDDHLNFEYYQDYVERMQEHSSLPVLELEDRVTVRAFDGLGQPLGRARITVTGPGGDPHYLSANAGANGVLYLFPGSDAPGADRLLVTARGPQGDGPSASRLLVLSDLPEDRTVHLTVEGVRAQPTRALDLMFVVDTTGSMSDELRYLTAEFRDIVEDIRESHPGLAIRYGLIVYRDERDAYVVRSLGFTSSVDTMQGWLADQRAVGGGDYPEAVDRALATAMQESWSGTDAIRMLFHVADAPPHVERYGATMDAVRLARAQGIQIHPIAASGVAEHAEYLMRASAVLTGGRYLFLTDDSGIGNPHAEPTVACYVVTTLNDLVVRVVGSAVTGVRVEPAPDEVLRTVGYYQAGVCLDQGPDDGWSADPPREDPVLSDPGAGGEGWATGEALESDAVPVLFVVLSSATVLVAFLIHRARHRSP